MLENYCIADFFKNVLSSCIYIYLQKKTQAENEVRQLRSGLSSRKSNAPSTVTTPVPSHSPKLYDHI